MRNPRLGRSGSLLPRWVFTSRLLAILFICGLPAISQNGKAAPVLDVQKLMSASEFRQSGLLKLSAEEIDALNVWLNRFAVSHGDFGQKPSCISRMTGRRVQWFAR